MPTARRRRRTPAPSPKPSNGLAWRFFALCIGLSVAWGLLQAAWRAPLALSPEAMLPLIGVVGVAAVVWEVHAHRATARRQAELRRQAEAEQRRRDTVLASTDAMSGPEFEQLVARLLRYGGWRDVQVHGGANDRGADVSARADDGRKLVVQCKRYRHDRPVGSPAMQAFMGTHRAIHGADLSWYVTTSGYTAEARRLAEHVGIRLIDRDALASWMLQAAAAAVGSPELPAPRPHVEHGSDRTPAPGHAPQTP